MDDFYAAAPRGEAREAMMVFARLVKCLLGDDAIADKKLDCGAPLTVLGVTIHIKDEGLHLIPEPSKVTKWTAQVRPSLCV